MAENTSFANAFGNFYKKAFDFKGEASANEYACPFLIQLSITLIDTLMVFLIYKGNNTSKIVWIASIVLSAYLVLTLIPWISLTVRRLRTIGKSAWYVLFFAIVGVGLVILLAIGSFGTKRFKPEPIVFNPDSNIIECVYGPPEMIEEFNPEDNIENCVYGPPEMFEDETDGN